MYTYALLFAARAPLTSSAPTGILIGIAVIVIAVIAALIVIPNAVKSAREKNRIKNLSSTFELYTVKQGDTLWSIAETFFGDGTKLSQIKSLNEMKLDGVVPGQILKIRELKTAK